MNLAGSFHTISALNPLHRHGMPRGKTLWHVPNYSPSLAINLSLSYGDDKPKLNIEGERMKRHYFD